MRLYLDTNIFIYALEADADEGRHARAVMQRMERGGIDAFTSEVTLAELLRGGEAALNTAVFDGYLDLFSGRSDFSIVPISREILIGSARLEVERKIDLTDAIHVATALAFRCDFFLTEDRRLPLPTRVTKLALKDGIPNI